MALEFLCSDTIELGKKIKIPEGANFYIRKSKTISPNKEGNPRVNFFNVNSNPTNRMKLIPENAGYISFDIQGNRFTIEYGEPKFYKADGKILKISDNY